MILAGPPLNANGFNKIFSRYIESVKEGPEVFTGGEQIGKKGYYLYGKVDDTCVMGTITAFKSFPTDPLITSV